LAQAIFEPNLFPYKYRNILNPSYSSYLPTYEDGTECSETMAYKIQTSGKYPEESIQHSEHGKSLKSRTLNIVYSNNPQVKNGTVTCYIVKKYYGTTKF
jgi:hypothetical protein